jgi:hypothetical protein
MTGMILERKPQQLGLELSKEGIIIQQDWKGFFMNVSTSAIGMHLIMAFIDFGACQNMHDQPPHVPILDISTCQETP